MQCPRCRSQSVRVSRSGNARIFFPASMFVTSLRCHNCLKRFLRPSRLIGGAQIHQGMQESDEGTTTRETTSTAPRKIA